MKITVVSKGETSSFELDLSKADYTSNMGKKEAHVWIGGQDSEGRFEEISIDTIDFQEVKALKGALGQSIMDDPN